MESTKSEVIEALIEAWEAIMKEPQLLRARQKLSLHEMRHIINHAVNAGYTAGFNATSRECDRAKSP